MLGMFFTVVPILVTNSKIDGSASNRCDFFGVSLPPAFIRKN